MAERQKPVEQRGAALQCMKWFKSRGGLALHKMCTVYARELVESTPCATCCPQDVCMYICMYLCMYVCNIHSLTLKFRWGSLTWVGSMTWWVGLLW